MEKKEIYNVTESGFKAKAQELIKLMIDTIADTINRLVYGLVLKFKKFPLTNRLKTGKIY